VTEIVTWNASMKFQIGASDGVSQQEYFQHQGWKRGQTHQGGVSLGPAPRSRHEKTLGSEHAAQ